MRIIVNFSNTCVHIIYLYNVSVSCAQVYPALMNTKLR